MATNLLYLKRILVVEENPHIAGILVYSLSSNFNVTLATSYKEAIKHLNQNSNFDCVITELELSSYSGIELIKLVHANELICHIPIIVLSGALDSNTRITCLEAGADGYIAKPFNPLEVEAKVKAIFRRSLTQSTGSKTIQNVISSSSRKTIWASRLRDTLIQQYYILDQKWNTVRSSITAQTSPNSNGQ